MPDASQRAIRAALLRLTFGAAVGMLMLVNKALPFGAWPWMLLPIHIQCMLVGWMLQLAYGVAFWILPCTSSDGGRGSARLNLLIHVTLNGGVVMNAIAALARLHGPALLAAALYFASALSIVLQLWPRLRPLVLTLAIPHNADDGA